jgi:pimeloyl-ACP methyl ester carboxylesterase
VTVCVGIGKAVAREREIFAAWRGNGFAEHSRQPNRSVDIIRPPKWKRAFKRGVCVVVGLLASAAIFGFAFQAWRDARIRATHPAPGKFVTLEGRQVHYRLHGEGTMTFVLEPGLGDYSGDWGEMEEALGKIARVFVYDRAGLGWSDESSRPRTAEQITTELHEVLERARIPKPYLLVGHSFGGWTQTLYAIRYPGDVAGLLLIDPAHKDQMRRMPGPPVLMTFLMTQISRTAAFGLPQLLMGASDPIKNQTRYVRAAGAEMRGFLSNAGGWGDRALDLRSTPIYVLTAGENPIFPGKSAAESDAIWATWRALHAELVAASKSDVRKQEIVAGATHYIYRTRPDAVIAAAAELVERIETRPPRR